MKDKLDFENATQEILISVNSSVSHYNNLFLREMILRGAKFNLHEIIIKPKLNLSPGKSTLEVGVGSGTHLGSYKDTNYTGIDINQNHLDRANYNAQKFGYQSNPTVLRKGNRIPFDDKTFDNVFSVCSLHEIPNIYGELNELDRVLKPEGKIVLVERLCALGESQGAIRNLKNERTIFSTYFRKKDYKINVEDFRATYFGESLQDEPSFRFFVFTAQK